MNSVKELIRIINEFDAPLFRARGLHIRAARGRTFEDINIALINEDGVEVATMQVYTRAQRRLAPLKTIELSLGFTDPAHQRQGLGTILRALICEAAREAGYDGVTQFSTAIAANNVGNSNRALWARRRLLFGPRPSNNSQMRKNANWRPGSAYIMNKLGFNIRYKDPDRTYEDRILYFVNVNTGNMRPTPKLNSVVKWVFQLPRR